MQIGFYFDQTRCTGCSACRVACKDWNDIPAGPENWMRVLYTEKGKFPKPFVSHMVAPCWHCIDPVCARACPADAITKRETDGIVLVDSDVCLGNEECDEKCLKACPYDAPDDRDLVEENHRGRAAPRPERTRRKCSCTEEREGVAARDRAVLPQGHLLLGADLFNLFSHRSRRSGFFLGHISSLAWDVGGPDHRYASGPAMPVNDRVSSRKILSLFFFPANRLRHIFEAGGRGGIWGP